MKKEKILKLLEKIKEELNSENLKLENHNFQVDSNGWKKKTIDDLEILESPTKDIWEINEGKLKGEQLFTWEAAIRETKKTGKRMPDDDEFSKIIKTKEDIKNLVFIGYRNTDGWFCDRSTDTFFWSSSESGANAWRRHLYTSFSTDHRHTNDKQYGFSVRCIQD